MTSAIDRLPSSGTKASLPSVLTSVIFGGSVIVIGLSIYAIAVTVATGELVRPIPSALWMAVVVVTLVLSVLAFLRRLARAGSDAAPARSSNFDALVGAPLAMLIFLSAAARFVVQVVGFGYLHPVPVLEPFTVVATTHDRAHNNDYYRLRLRLGADGRTFSDRVDRAVYEAAREGDTVALPVETGRFGLERAMTATPIAVADLHHPA